MNLRPAFLLAVIVSIFASCTKIESTDIGSGLIPPVDNINTFDVSLPVQTWNFLDTGVVFPLRSDNLVLGRINNDPLFGKTTGIVNLELKPEFYKYRFLGVKDSLKLDSMVLVLGYKGTWGDTTKPQQLNVYEITQATGNKLYPDSLYSTRKRFQYNPALLGSATVDVRNLLKDTLQPNREIVSGNQIRIPITNATFRQRMFELYDTTNAYLSDSAFRDNFAGFGIVPDTMASTANSLMLISLADTNTKFAVYYSYRIAGSAKRDTGVAYFRFSARSGFSNTVIRNPVGAEYLNHTSTAAADSLLYLQTRPDAPYARIKIPALDTVGNRIIHRAELIMREVRDPANLLLDRMFGPPALFLTAYSTDSARRFMLPGGDVQFGNNGVNNLAEFGVFPYTRHAGDTTYYSFNVTRYVQGIVTSKNRNYELALSAPFADYFYAVENFGSVVPVTGSGVLNQLAIGRTRLGGGSHSRSPMRLRIIYTRL